MTPIYPGFLVRVLPSGAKTYYAIYQLRDRRRNRIRLGRTNLVSAADTRKRAQTVLGDAARGLDPKEDERLVPPHTLLGFIDNAYGPWVVTDQKTGKQTITRLKTTFHGLVEMKLQAIGLWHLEKWRIERLEQGRSEGTYYRELTALKRTLTSGPTKPNS